MTEHSPTGLASNDDLALLARLDAALQGVALTPLDEARYLETHAIFEGSSSQQGRIMKWFADRAEELRREGVLRVLSVGCGSGILDLSIARSLAPHCDELVYTGVDPNEVECEAHARAFAEARIPGVRHSVSASTFEDLDTPDRFDLVHFVHCLYYMADPEAALRKARGLLAPGGSLVVFQAPCEELNRIAKRFYDRLYGRPTHFAEDLRGTLTGWEWEFEQRRLDAKVDVTPLVRGDGDTGTALRDFIVQVDGRRLPGPARELVDRYVQVVSKEREGRTYVEHPVDVFVIADRASGP